MEWCRKRLVVLLRRLLSTDEIADEHKRRRTLLVGVISIVSLCFVLTLFLIRLFTESIDHDQASQSSFGVFFIAFAVLGGGLYLLRKGLIQIVSVVLLGLILFCCLRGSFTWGVDLYTINIIYPLLILLAAVLLGRRFAFLFLLLVILFLSVIFFLHDWQLIAVNREWRAGRPDFFNLLTILLVYLFMSLLAWLTVREVECALAKERVLNAELRQAKKNLEDQVRRRTESLEKLQLEQLLSVSAFVELGKLSAGLLHDLRQPLSVLHILAQSYQDEQFDKSLTEVDDLLTLNQNQHHQQSSFELFSLQTEVAKLLSLFKYKLEENRVKITIQTQVDYDLYAQRKVFRKVLANLLMNAIEAVDADTSNRQILVSWKRNRLGLKVMVKDFGVGMTVDEQRQLFTPRFSRKGSLGLGLYLSNEAMKQSYKTEITFQSESGQGSTFIMNIKNKFIYEDAHSR